MYRGGWGSLVLERFHFLLLPNTQKLKSSGMNMVAGYNSFNHYGDSIPMHFFKVLKNPRNWSISQIMTTKSIIEIVGISSQLYQKVDRNPDCTTANKEENWQICRFTLNPSIYSGGQANIIKHRPKTTSHTLEILFVTKPNQMTQCNEWCNMPHKWGHIRATIDNLGEYEESRKTQKQQQQQQQQQWNKIHLSSSTHSNPKWWVKRFL